MARVSRTAEEPAIDERLPVAEPAQGVDAVHRRLVRPMPADRVLGWFATLFVGTVAAILRFWDLGRPDRIVFDETYYAKDALALLKFGSERNTIEGADERLITGNLDIFTGDASFVVHPPAGKWIIGGGIELFGMTPFGWRFAVALCGVLSAMILVRAGRRLFRSTLLGLLAGLFLAVDGMSIAVSRVAILDGILTMFIVAAFACLLVDRDSARARYAQWTAESPGVGDGSPLTPLLGWRPWRLAAGLLLGLAIATKWSGLFALAAFGLLTVIWEVSARRAARRPEPWLGAFADGLVAFVTMVGTAAVTYLATWWGWLAGDNGWSRNWAADNAPSFLGSLAPDWLRSLWHYHWEMSHFHTGLDTEHVYQSQAWDWLILARPVAIDYSGLENGEQGCSVADCSQEILALGTPPLWWGGCVALLVCIWMWLIRRDWRAGAILAGVLATWIPWLFFVDRTTFAFYAAAVAPFLVLAVTYVLGLVLGGRADSPDRRALGAGIVGAYTLIVLIIAAMFYPIHVDQVIPKEQWQNLMWFSSWI
jgi:dolichyl-phosphate-mannose--protein O-mannosyl transferase